MTDGRGDRLRYGLLAAGTLLVGLAGYVGYVLYPRFGLPSVAGASVLLLAAGAGFAAFFSPCSFPLLATLLARQAGGDDISRARRLRRALLFATAMSVGAVAFVLAVGAVFAFGGRGLAATVTFTSVSGRIIRGVVGVSLVLLGLVQSGRLQLNLRWFEPAIHGLLEGQARLRRERPVAGNAVFGFGYLAAGFG